MKINFRALGFTLFLAFILTGGHLLASSQTTNLKLNKPGKGDRNWGQTINDNMDKIDSAIGTIQSKSDDLPEVYVYTGTFNSTTGYQISLPKSVDNVNEYAVKITPTSRAGAIGDIYVTKTTSNFTVKCSEANTTDTFSASVYYIGNVSAYGGAMYRKWYVSPDTGITDHGDSSQTGSLAWVQAQISTDQAAIELVGNKTYQIKQNLTVADNIQLIFQKGGIIDTDFSIRDSNYEWYLSGSGTSEYYLQASGGGNPNVNQPAVAIENNSQMTEGNAGSLAAGEWDWNDNDSLGYATIYVRLSDGTDPDSKSADYVESGYLLTLPEPPEVGLRQIFDGNGNVSFSTPRVTRPEWWYSGSGSYDFALEQAVVSQCRIYADSDSVPQCGEVIFSQVYGIDDTFIIARPVHIIGNFIEESTGPSRAPRSGARIVSTISSASKDIIEIPGTDIGGGTYIVGNITIENIGIIGSGSERDAIRISSPGYIFGLNLRNIHVHGPGKNGLTVTSDNNGYDYSIIDNVRVFNAGQDSFSFESGASDSVGVQFINGRSGSATRYGLYLAVSGFKVDNFIEDTSGTSGVRLNGIHITQFTNCTTETGSNEGWYFNASYGNTLINCISTNNVGDQYYLSGGSHDNLFIGCSLNKIGAEHHITYAAAADKNNVWLLPQFYETKDVSDSGSQNIYLFERDLTEATPRQYIISGGSNDVIYYDSILGSIREPFATKTSAYTITAKDKYIYANASGGAFNVTLPTADNSLRGQPFCIKKIDSSANAVTVVGSIEGGNVTLSAQYDYVWVICDGGSGLWWIVGQS